MVAGLPLQLIGPLLRVLRSLSLHVVPDHHKGLRPEFEGYCAPSNTASRILELPGCQSAEEVFGAVICVESQSNNKVSGSFWIGGVWRSTQISWRPKFRVRNWSSTLTMKPRTDLCLSVACCVRNFRSSADAWTGEWLPVCD